MRHVLRCAQDSDKAWLEELRRLVYEDLFYATWGYWDESRHQRQFTDCWNRGGIELIMIDDQRVGMVQLSESDSHLEIGEIQVHPEYQGTGIGTRLLCDVIDRAKRQGTDVVLSTGLMNLRAARLYRRLGFVETERTDTHIHFSYFAKRL
jgi:ribosomal protein S18 acetylase RimI-like enzyme